MQFETISKAKKLTGLSYLGNVSTSSKIAKSEKYEELTYVLYLAPHTLSGYNVCPQATEHCKASCLFESGHNRIDIHENRITQSRITKTKLYFEHRDFFSAWVFAEIEMYQRKAANLGYKFSVRLNGTSDINPETIKVNGLNVFQKFPNTQFYDYSKVLNRMKLLTKYPNYDLTYSFSGDNWLQCEVALMNNMRVAVVFDEVPLYYMGYDVIDGDRFDMRYLDPTNCIVGLKFKKVRNKINLIETPFVINVRKVAA